MPGHIFFASPTLVPVFTPKRFASTLAAMHTVVSASIGTTPSGLPRSRGSTCCSTEAKYELKSTRSERRVTRASAEVGRLHEDARDFLEHAGLGLAEAREHRAVHVQHPDDASAFHHGNDDL